MQYKAVILDIDGTILPHGEAKPRREVVEMIEKVRALGVAIVIATGRTYYGIPNSVLGAVKPDYTLCANGAHLVNKGGRTVFCRRFTAEEMYALVDYFEDFDLPLGFSFDDQYYVYVEYAKLRQIAPEYSEVMEDGENQNRHLQGMPFGGFAALSAQQLQGFQARHGHLGLRFTPIFEGTYDVMQKDVDKASGLVDLMARNGWDKSEIIFMGDNDNDVELMEVAGLSYCVENGSAAAKAAAKRLAPSVWDNGVATALKEVFFADEL